MSLNDIQTIFHIEDNGGTRKDVKDWINLIFKNPPKLYGKGDVQSAREFLEQNQERIDLILLDDTLPDNPGGRESSGKAENLVIEIRKLEQYKDCPILLASVSSLFGSSPYLGSPFVQGEIKLPIDEEKIQQTLQALSRLTEAEIKTVKARISLDVLIEVLHDKLLRSVLNPLHSPDIDLQQYYDKENPDKEVFRELEYINQGVIRNTLVQADATLKELRADVRLNKALDSKTKELLETYLNKLEVYLQHSFLRGTSNIDGFSQRLNCGDDYESLMAWLDEHQKEFEQFHAEYEQATEAFNEILSKLYEMKEQMGKS